ncbi:MAG: spondin domain-containing protein [Planctomycetota bacterium]
MHRTISAAALAAAAVAAHASTVTVTFENTQAQGGFSFTPVWVALHNGGFDTYDGGQLAFDTGLTPLAEDGITDPIQQGFADSAAGLAGGVDGVLADNTGAPVFSGGESNSLTLNAGDTTVNRYFSFASMVVPSNDLFIGNGNPFAHEVFDAAGNFTGPVEILIFGSDVNDNGTEINDAFAGAAFSANGGDGIDESVVVTNFFDLDGADAYLATFVNTSTVDGGLITQAFGADNLIGRITIVPTPGAFAAFGLAGVAAVRRRR